MTRRTLLALAAVLPMASLVRAAEQSKQNPHAHTKDMIEREVRAFFSEQGIVPQSLTVNVGPVFLIVAVRLCEGGENHPYLITEKRDWAEIRTLLEAKQVRMREMAQKYGGHDAWCHMLTTPFTGSEEQVGWLLRPMSWLGTPTARPSHIHVGEGQLKVFYGVKEFMVNVSPGISLGDVFLQLRGGASVVMRGD